MHQPLCLDSQLAQLRISTNKFLSVLSGASSKRSNSTLISKGHSLLNRWKHLYSLSTFQRVKPNEFKSQHRISQNSAVAIQHLSKLLNVPYAPNPPSDLTPTTDSHTLSRLKEMLIRSQSKGLSILRDIELAYTIIESTPSHPETSSTKHSNSPPPPPSVSCPSQSCSEDPPLTTLPLHALLLLSDGQLSFIEEEDVVLEQNLKSPAEISPEVTISHVTNEVIGDVIDPSFDPRVSLYSESQVQTFLESRDFGVQVSPPPSTPPTSIPSSPTVEIQDDNDSVSVVSESVQVQTPEEDQVDTGDVAVNDDVVVQVKEVALNPKSNRASRSSRVLVDRSFISGERARRRMERLMRSSRFKK
ncbi:hypothetical protein GEMRC1_014120 [Eukaryota sp. GEM-RC1]